MFSPQLIPFFEQAIIVAIAMRKELMIFLLAITPHTYFLINIQQFLYLPVAT